MENLVAAMPVYTDMQGLNSLKQLAKSHDPQAIKEVAKQFEALLLQTLLKSVRESNKFLSDEESNDLDFYYEMFDQQIAQVLASKGLGFGDKIASSMQPQQFFSRNILNAPLKGMQEQFNSPLDFIKNLWNDAKAIAKKIGLDPKVILSQAALETAWGQKIPKDAQGKSSFNLFGIKADKSWKKATLPVTTLEYKAGIPVKTSDHFRAYASFLDSLNDYADFLKQNPRYRVALENVNDNQLFAKSLQEAGFATDPNYAQKIISIVNSDIFTKI